MPKDIYDQIVVEEPKGYTRVPKPTPADIADCEARLGHKLPATYLEFVQKYGPGELGAFLRIAAPGSVPHYMANLAQSNQDTHAGQDLLIRIYGEADLIRSAVFFGSTYVGDLVGWDVRAVTDADGSEYAVFVLPRNWNKIVRLPATTFRGLVTDVVEGRMPEPMTAVQAETRADRRVFLPFFSHADSAR
jgi:hypothetical protein